MVPALIAFFPQPDCVHFTVSALSLVSGKKWIEYRVATFVLPWYFDAVILSSVLLFVFFFNLVPLPDEEVAYWPSFRGPHARGVDDSHPLPLKWNGETSQGVLWKTPIPGLAHSSPVIYGNRIFITTAISSQGDTNFKHGLYGAGTASSDDSPQRWNLYAIDRRTGEVLWERTAHEGVPQFKRHIKSTYASSTPATDGKYVVAFFGSEGLFAYTVDGKYQWKKDLGDLNLGAYDAPTYEWGPASSPVIYEGLVLVQTDTQKEDYLWAIDLQSGNTVWRTERDELPSWGTPTVYPGDSATQVVTNASNFIRSNDLSTGEELWRLGGSSKITAPTPTFSEDLIIVASGRRPEKPIFAIRPEARGDITLTEGREESKAIAWSKVGVGPYMPTPLIYGNYVYTLQNNGILHCYELQTGQEVYRNRVAHRGGGFSGSPVAGRGHLYLPGEDGDVIVVRAGPEFEVVEVNPMGELLMTTPALAKGKIYIRTQHHLFAIGELE